MTNAAEVPSVMGVIAGVPPIIVAFNTPVTAPLVYVADFINSVYDHVPALTPYSGSVDRV
jgi:hypothetical protein